MDSLQSVLPSKIYHRIEQAGINTVNQILTLSSWDIKKLTNLTSDDVLLLKDVTADSICPTIKRGNDLFKDSVHTSTGFERIDKIMHGGYRKGTLTELYGESGSGKTQLAMQSAIHNWKTGCAYICTEDVFPVKRFEQMKQSISNYNSSTDYGKNIFIEHLTEPQQLLASVTVHLPKILKNIKLSLVIVDSIAAPYRCENTNYIQRAEEMREIAIALIDLAQKYDLAVLCINQVTAAIDTPNECLPSLGLAWANMISCRLFLHKTNRILDTNTVLSKTIKEQSKDNLFIRKLKIIFSPDLPENIIDFVILNIGLYSC